MGCTQDSAAGGSVCEYECVTVSDCPDVATLCLSGFCAVNQCGGGTGNGQFNSTCNAQGTNDGTCEPLTLDAGLSSIGYCIQAGTDTGPCDPNPTRLTPGSQVCLPGSLCFGGIATFGGTCNQLCNPPSGTCPRGQACSPIVNEPALGICL